MKSNLFNKLFGGILLLLFCAAVNLHAQQRFGGGGGGGFGGGGFGGGGFGGGGFGGGNRGGTSGSGNYNYNGSVGSAIISVDPVTHNLIVIADKQTTEQIRRVVASLDAPEPQVLIKVVFLEVQHNNSSEIGVEGSYTGNWLGSGLSQITGYVTNYSVSPLTSNALPSIVPKSITPIYQNQARQKNSGAQKFFFFWAGRGTPTKSGTILIGRLSILLNHSPEFAPRTVSLTRAARLARPASPTISEEPISSAAAPASKIRHQHAAR